MRAVLHRLLFPMVFVLPAWILVWWMATGAPLDRLLANLVAMPTAFVEALAIALLAWLRPDVREQRALTWDDAIWVSGTWLAWLVGGALPEWWGVVVMFLAFWIGVFAILRLWRRFRTETARRLDDLAAASRHRRPGAAPDAPSTNRGPGGQSSGPHAGKVITVLPTPPNSDGGDQDDAADGYDDPMPGSTRTGGGIPRVDDTTAGVNFGANRAPVSPTWDPTRPVPGALGETPDLRAADDAAPPVETIDLDESAADADDPETADTATETAGEATEIDDDEWAGPGARR